MNSHEQRAARLRERLAAAIDRIASGNPANVELANLKSKLRLNVRTVCKEANVSRTLLAQEANCPYPEVRTWLLEKIFSTSPVTAELRQRVAELENRVSELKDELDRSSTYHAELIARTHAAERGLGADGRTAAKATKAQRIAALSVVGTYKD